MTSHFALPQAKAAVSLCALAKFSSLYQKNPRTERLGNSLTVWGWGGGELSRDQCPKGGDPLPSYMYIFSFSLT